MNKYTREYRKRQEEILRLVFYLNGITAQELAILHNPRISKRRIQIMLTQLVQEKDLRSYQFYPVMSSTSPVAYLLTAKGASRIGINQLAGSQKRKRGIKFYNYLHAPKLLRIFAKKYNCILIEHDASAKLALQKFLAYKTGNRFSPMQFRKLMPRKISPDIVLATPTKAIIAIIAHPNADSPFFLARKKKYRDLLSNSQSIEFVIVAVDDERSFYARQLKEAKKAFTALSVTEMKMIRRKLYPSLVRRVGEEKAEELLCSHIAKIEAKRADRFLFLQFEQIEQIFAQQRRRVYNSRYNSSYVESVRENSNIGE